MSNIDKISKEALREVAEDAQKAHKWEGLENGLKADGYVSTTVRFIQRASPQTVLALLDELEAADALNKHLELAIRKAEGCSEALRRKAEAAEKRIAELEAREVNLPKRTVGEVMHMSGFSRDYAEGWCSGNDNAIHEIHLAGVNVAAAGKGD